MGLAKAELERARPLGRQIADHVREQIRAGTLAGGEMLPAAAELAATWGVDAATVHRGLAKLAKEGLLYRKPGVGTFVRDSRPVLRTVGIYLAASALCGDSPFRQALAERLRAELTRNGLAVQFFLDPREAEAAETPLPQLVHAIDHHQVQALILPSINPHLTKWIPCLKVPCVTLSRKPEHLVDVDHAQFIDLALRALCEAGCRTVGLLCPETGEHLDMTALLVDAARDQGLQLRDSWVVRVDCWAEKPPHPTHQKVGYDGMQRLLAAPELPEGLVIYPDSLAAGAILALVESGVAIPERMRLVVHRNRGVPLLCPFPATYVESDPAEVAAMLVQQIRKLYEGEQVQRVQVRHYLAEA